MYVQLAEALTATGADDKDVDHGDADSAEAGVESLKQMMEILVGDLCATKTQLESTTQQICHDNTTTTTASSDPAGGEASATIEALHAANRRLEAELEAAQLENTAMTRQATVLRDRLNNTESELEEALFEISRLDQGGDGADGRTGTKRDRQDDDEATETDEDERGSGRSYSDGEGSRSYGSHDDDHDEEADNPQPRGEQDVIDLSESPPRPKRQRQYSDQEDDVAGEGDYEDV